jgi:hypothetical protein
MVGSMVILKTLTLIWPCFKVHMVGLMDLDISSDYGMYIYGRIRSAIDNADRLGRLDGPPYWAEGKEDEIRHLTTIESWSKAVIGCLSCWFKHKGKLVQATW